MDHIQALIDKLEAESRISREEWITLIEGRSPNLAEYLFEKARKWQHRYYGNNVFARGLIEFTNYCKNDCYYCGIRWSAARLVTHWAFGRLCCKEGKTGNFPRRN